MVKDDSNEIGSSKTRPSGSVTNGPSACRARPRTVLCTQERDAERDPRSLEDEEANVVDRIDIQCDCYEDPCRSDERQHPCAPEGMAEPGRDQ